MDAQWLADLAEGQALFNAGRFFKAHDRFEESWRRQTGDRKLCAQGLVQVCAAFHKARQAGKAVPGAVELLEKGCDKVRRASGALPEGCAQRLLADLEPRLALLRAGRVPDALTLRLAA